MVLQWPNEPPPSSVATSKLVGGSGGNGTRRIRNWLSLGLFVGEDLGGSAAFPDPIPFSQLSRCVPTDSPWIYIR